MKTFNAITSAIFQPLLGWFGTWSAWIDILFWSILGGIVALLVYKLVSNQKGIEKAKNDIKVHLLEIRLFQDDIGGVLSSTAKILGKNVLYIGHNVLPMLVMFVPMMTILFQLEASYALTPVPQGSTQVLTCKLDRDVTDVPARDVRLDVPQGLTLTAGPVPAGDEIAWRLRADAPGEHELVIHAGGGSVSKRLAVAEPQAAASAGVDGRNLRIPYLRTKSWSGYLYPGEEALPGDSPVYEVKIKYPERDLGWMPGGEFGILLTFFVVSIAAGLALKGVFGVTL